MNERIRLFEEQATTYIKPVPGHSGEGWIFNKELFAALIIQECMNVAVNKDAGISYTADVAGYVAAGRSNAARAIKQHFEGI